MTDPLTPADCDLRGLPYMPLDVARSVRVGALSEWVKCSDGRLYHPIIAERANVVWPKMQAIRRRTIRRLEILSEEWAALRRFVFARDGYRCTYCGASDQRLECDHIIPVSRGGASIVENLTTACKPCNRSKRDKLLSEWAH